LTGSASWAYYAATQYILGIQPEYEGLRIDPCIPSKWKGFTVTRKFRRNNLRISVKNETGVQKGVRYIVINGERIDGNLIPLQKIKEENNVIVTMGR